MVKCAVIGCGQMGVRIAGELAYHGHRVKVWDHNTNVLDDVYQKLEDDKDELINEGLMSHSNFLGQVLCMSSIDEAVRDAEFVFEAIVDDLMIKQTLFEKISQCCNPEAIISSNTLYLSVSRINEKTPHKERVLGLRFLYPVYAIPEIEIMTTTLTTTKVIEKVRKFLERMGKTMFFRSGSEPMILSDEQVQSRKAARKEQIRLNANLCGHLPNTLPNLSHYANCIPVQDDPTIVVNERDCAICMDRPRDCLLCPCHHMCTCLECAKSLLNRKDCCPICRKEITELIRIFHS